MQHAILTEEEVDQIDHRAKSTIQKATEVALTLPEPNPENVEDGVYAP